MTPTKDEIESALKSRETSVTTRITVSIGGQAFDITRKQAEGLRDQLNSALGQSESRPLFPLPPPTIPTYPSVPWERPWWNKDIICCTR